jgi:hypothetical protein
MLRRCIWRAVFKKLFEKIRKESPASLDSAMSIGNAVANSTNDRYIFTVNRGNGTSFDEIFYPGVAYTEFAYPTTVTVDTISEWAADINRQWNTTQAPAVLYAESVYISRITFVPGDASRLAALPQVGIRMLDSSVSMDIKCTLKMQNRSQNALTGTGEDNDVDNVPIYGYMYSGKGAGPIHKAHQGVQFLAGELNGVISYGANTNAPNALQEPPLAGDFVFVDRQGKMKLEPGDIKTSVLTYKKSHNFQKFYRKLVNLSATRLLPEATYRDHSGVGEYKLFALEKMIDTDQGPDQPSILLAFEHNIRGLFAFTEKYSYTTVQKFESSVE